MSETFTLTGTIDGQAREVGWRGGVFSDPSGAVLKAIAEGEVIPWSPTGPDYPAAATPADAALMTALSVFDSPNVVLDEGADAILTLLHDGELAVPDDAVA